MTDIIRRRQLVTALVALFTLTSAGIGYSRPAEGRAPSMRAAANAMMTCSNSTGSISPCTSSATVNSNTSGNRFIFTITNSSAGYVEGNISCGKTGQVSACTVSNTGYELNGHTSMTDTITYSVGAIGSGTVTATTGGLIGALTATLTVTVVAPYAVSVTPKSYPMSVGAQLPGTAFFTVYNTGTNSATFNLSTICVSSMTGCTITDGTSVTLAPNTGVYSTVTFTAGAAGTTGVVKEVATYVSNSAITDTGSYNVTSAVTVNVYPDTLNEAMRASSHQNEWFHISNGRPASVTYNLTVACTGGITGCSAPASVTMAAGADTVITVPFIAAPTYNAVGSVILRAVLSTDAGNKDTAYVRETSGTATCTTQEIDLGTCTLSLSPYNDQIATPVTISVTNRDRVEALSVNIFCTPSGIVTLCHNKSGSIPANSVGNFPDTIYTAYGTGSGRASLAVYGGDSTVVGIISVTKSNHPPGPPTHLVALSPHYEALEEDPSQLDTATFVLKNAGGDTAWFRYTRGCTGSGIASGCTPATDSVKLNPSATASIPAIFTTAATIGLKGKVSMLVRYASDSMIRDSASLDVTVTAGTPGVSVSQLNPGSALDRSLCLTVSLGAAAAMECGDLRLLHVFPATRTYGKSRVPTLLYNSAHAHPFVTIRADYTLPTSGAIPDSVTAILRDSAGASLATGSWSGNQWRAKSTRRIALSFDASTKPTGIYKYKLLATRWTGGTGAPPDSALDEFVVVNRMKSPFGPGWWLAGNDQLFLPGNTTMLWVGGDGSARKYTSYNDSTWYAANVNRPDTLKKRGTNYEQLLKNGLIVRFNSIGQHIATVNRLGQLTTFHVGTKALLDSITLPPAAAVRRYRFTYDSTDSYGWKLRVVRAPSVNGQLRFDSLRYNASDQVTVMRRIDGTTITYAYDASVSNRVTARTNERGFTTTYGYGAGSILNQITAPLDSVTNAVSTYTAWETRGLAGTSAMPVDIAYGKVDGPRTDVGDTTLFWLDKFGEPRRVRNALGDETILSRSNPTWPALVTRSQAPNGQVLGATYDSRGNITADSDSTTYDVARGKYAVTRYTWDAKWDFMTRVVRPEGDSTTFSYDATTGNVLWKKDGRGDSTRSTFTYWPTGDPSGGQLKSVVTATGTLDSLFYDALLGNVQLAREPLGQYTQFATDSIGRVIQTVSPVSGSIVLTKVDTLDLMDEVLTSRTYAGSDTVRTRMHYDAVGNMDTLYKESRPDPNAIGVVTQAFGYDRANREIREQVVGCAACSAIGWTYDPAGNLLAGGRRPTTQTYDALGRVVTRSGGTYSTFTYDAAGHILTANNANARISRSYTINGTLKTDTLRIATRILSDSNFTTHVYGVGYGYDLDNRVKSMAYPGAFSPPDSARYAYEPMAGLMTSLTDIFGNRFNFTFDREARMTRLARLAQRPDSVWQILRYDSLSQMSVRIDTAAGTPIHHDSLRRDLRGKVVANVSGGDTLAYSAIGNLTYALIPSTDGTEIRTSDALGNQSVVTVFTRPFPTTYLYQPHTDRLNLSWQNRTGAPADTTYYLQDNYGGTYSQKSLQFFHPSGCGQLCGIYSKQVSDVENSYDAGRNMIQSYYTLDTIPAPLDPHYKHYRRQEDYRYDAVGRRVWQQMIRDTTCQTHDKSSGCRNEVTRTVWAGDQVLYEIRALADTTGSSSENDNSGGAFVGNVGYTHASGIDQPLELFKGSQLVVLYTNWEGVYDHGTCPSTACDGLNPFFPLTAGTVYGEVAATPNGPPSWYGNIITGMADGSGYQYKRNRYYDPASGRFTQEDPIGLAGGLSSYGFASGDPVSFSDPFGLWSTRIHDKMFATLTSVAYEGQVGNFQKYSKAFDSETQSPSQSYKHGMLDAASGQTENDAIEASDNFVESHLNWAAALVQLGVVRGQCQRCDKYADAFFAMAAHTVQDETSPWHRSNGIPLGWSYAPWTVIGHFLHEHNASPDAHTWAVITLEMNALYERVFGKKKKE